MFVFYLCLPHLDIACRIMDGGGWHFYSVGFRPQRYTALNGCVKENELVQNLTIIQHKGLGLVLVVFFTSQSIDSGDPGGSLGSNESFQQQKVDMV